MRAREILGSPGRSESQLLVTDSCNKRSIRGVAKGQKCLCPTCIGLGTGPRGGDCYSELPRMHLLGSWVVSSSYAVCADTGMLTPHARIAVPLSPQRRSAAGLPSPLPTPGPRRGRGRTPTAMPKERTTRGGKNAKKRAAVAVARKLSVLLHRLWVTGEIYDPLYNTRRRAQQEEAA